VVTNYHVVEAVDISVILENGDKYEGKVIGEGPKTDLAVVNSNRKEASGGELREFGRPQDRRLVLATQEPFGLGYTVTAGIVSAKGARSVSALMMILYRRTPPEPGNSGGPSLI
jgi:serine protease Do